jgi:hypothetical protein
MPEDDQTTLGSGTFALPIFVRGRGGPEQPPAAVEVEFLTMTSMYLKLYARGNHIGNGTGIFIQHGGHKYLVTAGHVLSGRDAETGKPLCKDTAAIPDQLRIAHHIRKDVGVGWRFDRVKLHDENGRPLWLEHPRGAQVDVAVLRIDEFAPDVEIYVFDTNMANVDIQPYPAMAVSVIGHPLGLRPTALFPVWKTGHVASDPDINYKDSLPAFLIDATTREGMSGSPVVVRGHGGFLNTKRIWVMGAGSNVTRFLGIYSGRISKDAEVGIVWRPQVIAEILAAGIRGKLRDGTDD